MHSNSEVVLLLFVAMAKDSALYNMKFMRLRISVHFYYKVSEYSKNDATDNACEKVTKKIEDTSM
jgi:hypothetical protein